MSTSLEEIMSNIDQMNQVTKTPFNRVIVSKKVLNQLCEGVARVEELEAEVERLKGFIHKRHKEHYECEDGYYSCPHAENAFDSDGNDYDDDFDKPCNCGKLEADDLLFGWKAQQRDK